MNSKPTTPWRILVVDDDEDLRSVLVDIFSDQGFKVESACDGVEGTLKVEASPFDAVIADIQMPRMNGFQFAANIKASKLNSNTAIFILSGNADDQVLKNALSLNVAKLLPKPFNEGAITEIVLETLEHRSSTTIYSPDIVRCSSDGLSQVLKSHLGENPTINQVASHNIAPVNGFASGIVSLTGQEVSGLLSLSMGQTLLGALSQAIFIGSQVKLNDSITADLAGEIANQIAGRVKHNLLNAGIDVLIGLPQVVLGLGHKVIHRTGGPILRLEFTVKGMSSSLDIGLKKEMKKTSRAAA